MSDIGDIKVLKRDVSNVYGKINKGVAVKIVGRGERGYDVETLDGSLRVGECGFDIFQS